MWSNILDVGGKKPLNFHNILDVYPRFLFNIHLLAAGTREINFNDMFQDWRDTSNLVSTSYLCNQCLVETHFFNNTVIQCLRNQNNQPKGLVHPTHNSYFTTETKPVRCCFIAGRYSNRQQFRHTHKRVRKSLHSTIQMLSAK